MGSTAGGGFFESSGGCPCAPLAAPLAGPEALIGDPSVRRRGFVVTVIGDVRLDVVSRLRAGRFVELDQDRHAPARVDTVVGGTAMSFARAAAPHFAEVRVVAAIGEDRWSDTIWAAASELGVRGCFEQKPGVGNALVLVVRDAPSEDRPDGVRLMLAQEPSPYDHLDVDLVLRRAPLIATSDALVIDGYALLNERSAAAVELAAEIADEAGVPISFDVVPHRIDERLAASRIEPFLRRASMSIAEAPTLARLMGLDAPAVPTLADAEHLARRMPAGLDGRQTRFIRFGHGMMEETLAVGAHPSLHYHTGYSQQPDGSGYGYLVAAAELKWWLCAQASTRRRDCTREVAPPSAQHHRVSSSVPGH